MTRLWDRYVAFFDARVLRERIIIALCVLACVYLIWDFFLVQTLNSKREVLDQRYAVAKSELSKIDAEQDVISRALQSNPNATKQREVWQLNERLSSLENEIEALSVGLVSASKLPDVLKEILEKKNDLTLIGLQAQEPEKLSLVNSDVDSMPGEDDIGVYKHRVILRFKGRYFSIRDYLAELESSEWNFYWSSFEYVVDGYPHAVAQLQVYTLSTDRGFISE